MAKRSGIFEQTSSKRAKFSEKFDDLWDDDFDEDAIDDCILQATQIRNESQDPNASIIPSYTSFAKPKFCSTQVSASPFKIQTSSSNNDDLKRQIKLLQKKFDGKESEVAFLRGQLKETINKVESERQKVVKESQAKIQAIEKTLIAVTTESEFKELKIATLKQNLSTITRRVKNTEVQEPKQFTRNEVIKESNYPLRHFTNSSLFKESSETSIADRKFNHTHRRTLPFLQNDILTRNKVKNIKIKSFLNDKSELTLGYVYPDVVQLIQYTDDEINSCRGEVCLNKILLVTLQLHSDFHEYLENIQSNIRTENIQVADSLYLAGGTEGDNLLTQDYLDVENQCGIKLAKLLNFLSQCLPYSHNLRQFIRQSKAINFSDFKESYKFPLVAHDKLFYSSYFLQTLLEVVKIIGRIRKSHVTSSFLQATVKLLISFCKSKLFNNVTDMFCSITKEIIFARPTLSVMCQLTFLLKCASNYTKFDNYLFELPLKTNVMKNMKRGIYLYKSDSCRFYIFAILFENVIINLNSSSLPVDVCLNMLCFIYNTYKWSFGLHHQDVISCECLPKLYKISIELIFKLLEIQNEEKFSEDWNQLFKQHYVLKIIKLISFHSYDLTEKYLTVFSQYKKIEMQLCDEYLNDFEKPNILEIIPEISSQTFSKYDF